MNMLVELEICNKPYKLGQCFTDVGLVCSHGKDKKRFHMDIMSNAPITEVVVISKRGEIEGEKLEGIWAISTSDAAG